MRVGLSPAPADRTRRRRHVWAAWCIAAWSLTVLWCAVAVVPLDVYWMSYYAADYAHGFVRRGLAGEVAGLIPGHYFGVTLGLRWLSTVAFLSGLVTLAWLVLGRRPWSERRMLIALLIPLLPFGVPFAAYSARPDLFGGAALAFFAAALSFARSGAAATACCAAYGVTTAALTLVHEAVGLQFALGAVLVTVVVGGPLRTAPGRGVLLAVLPGAGTATGVAVFGRHDVAAQLCSAVPHHPLPNPFATVTSPGTLLRFVIDGRPRQTDYHDWVCRNVLPSFDHSIVDAIHSVGHIGPVGLTMSFVFGAAAVAVTLWGVSAVSGVPVRAFTEALRGRAAWVLVGLALIVPVFLTGYDWTRWLTIVAFDVGVAFLPFAARRPEIDQDLSLKALRAFRFLAVGLALIPIGAVPGFGGPLMV
ncbi:hypothetical protein A5714_20840 [Mycobacterium sp. E2462]|nr:hypothetical protein A5714_20840 [Mycobacterium sp. E2462]